MTYSEAVEFCNLIEEFVVGTLVEGLIVQSVMIAPTSWLYMYEYLELSSREGEKAAGLQFSEQGRSFSVYGINCVCLPNNKTRLSFIYLDNWDMFIYNN